MDHKNVVKLIGVTIDPMGLTVYNEYCSKESLHSVLQRDTIPLGWSLRYVYWVGKFLIRCYFYVNRVYLFVFKNVIYKMYAN